MKTIIKKGSSKLGGLLFRHPNIEYMTLHEWLEKDCPKDTYIIGTPDQFLICNIPIVDALFDNGVFSKTVVGEPKLCKWKIPYYFAPKKSNSTSIPSLHHFDFITVSNPDKVSKKLKFAYRSV